MGDWSHLKKAATGLEDCPDGYTMCAATVRQLCGDILALIAENERLREQAVAHAELQGLVFGGTVNDAIMGSSVGGLLDPAPVTPPGNCRQRLAAEGKAYPRSGCAACGRLSPKWRECDAALAKKVGANG